MSEEILLYGTPICSMVPPVRGLLDRSAASYRYIDISQDDDARQRVREINDGSDSVPTLEFADGSTLTEPSLIQLQHKLVAMGYEVPPPTWADRLAPLLESPFPRILALGLALIGLLSRELWLLILGLVIVLLSLAFGWWRKRTV